MLYLQLQIVQLRKSYIKISFFLIQSENNQEYRSIKQDMDDSLMYIIN